MPDQSSTKFEKPRHGAACQGDATVSVSFRAVFPAVRQALADIQTALVAAEADLLLRQTAEIVLAEVLNNVVEHAYAEDGIGRVTVEIQVLHDRFDCLVQDSGQGLPPGPLPGAAMPQADLAEPEDWPEGGFGWALVRELTSNLTYRRAEGRNSLTFSICAQPGQSR
jgi:serine/threonine-protein kinase RsbW